MSSKVVARRVSHACLAASLLSLVGCASAGQVHSRSTGPVASRATGPVASRSAGPVSSQPAPPTAHVRLGGGAAGSAWKLDDARLMVSGMPGHAFADMPLPASVTPAEVQDISSSGSTLWLAAAKGDGVGVYRRKGTAADWQETDVRPAWPALPGVVGAPDRSVLEARPGLLTLITSKGISPTESANELFISTDDGASFTSSGSQLAVPWWQASFATASSGVVIGGPAHNLVFHTSDGGASWAPAQIAGLPAGAPVTYGDVIDDAGDLELPATRLLANQSYLLTIYLSHDGGASFVAQAGPGLPLPTTTNTAAVSGIGASLWAAPASGGELFTSSDAGRSWSRIDSPSLPSGAESISMASSGSGTVLIQQAGCRNGKTDCYVTSGLYTTSDGGSQWVAS